MSGPLNRKIDILLGVLFSVTGLYLMIVDWPAFSYFPMILLLAGVILISSSLIFGINNPEDEREEMVKLKGNSLSYVLTIIILFIYLMLVQFNKLTISLESIWIVFFLCLVVAPLSYFINNILRNK